jgi:dihydroorotate dehydrogenase
MYKLLRHFLFLFPTEAVHHFSMNMMKAACGIPWIRKCLRYYFRPPADILPEKIFGLSFPNPVGLAAGFDKNAVYLTAIQTLGFGFLEIGTVTPLPQAGNEKPRLFRLPKDKALINRMGFNNDGVKTVAGRLHAWRQKNPGSAFIIGGNIGKNKITPNPDAWKDYVTCFRELFPYVDYFVVNLSSPNTPGLRELQEKESLREILSRLQNSNRELAGSLSADPRPILLKIAPDLSLEQMDDIILITKETKISGLVTTNTTVSRSGLRTPAQRVEAIGNGGLSGLPLKERSTFILQYMHDKSGGSIPLIASGGVFTQADFREKMTAGASLAQVWTGFIYEGPGIVKKILKGLHPESR